MLQPAAAAGASAKEGPTPPPFHTPRPFVKSEPSATPHDSAGHMGGAGQGSAQLGQPGSHHRRQLQTSTGFDLAARQSLEQRSKTEGARPRPADAFAQVASLSQAAGPGLSFSVPRPPPGSFPGIESTFEGLREQGLRTELERTELERTDKGTHAQAAEHNSPAEAEEQQDTHSMAPEVVSKPTDASMPGLKSASLLSAEMPPVSNTDPSSIDTEAPGAAAQGSANVVSSSADSAELQASKAVAGNAQADGVVAGSDSVAEVQREAALAAAKDAQDAEQFAAQALQSPRLQSSPANKVSRQQLSIQNSMQQLCTQNSIQQLCTQSSIQQLCTQNRMFCAWCIRMQQHAQWFAIMAGLLLTIRVVVRYVSFVNFSINKIILLQMLS